MKTLLLHNYGHWPRQLASGPYEITAAISAGGMSAVPRVATLDGFIDANIKVTPRRHGNEIFYLDLDKRLMAAAVNGRGASFEVEAH